MIVTEQLRLRRWRDEDKPALAAFHADPEVMRHLGGVKSLGETGEIVDRLNRALDAGEPAFWAAEQLSDGVLVGWIGLNRVGSEFPFGPVIEVGWRLGRRFWGRGYATEGAAAALAHAFRVLRADRVVAFTVPANGRSEAVMHRIGMRRVKDGDFAHPRLAASDPLSHHILYAIEADDWAARAAMP